MKTILIHTSPGLWPMLEYEMDIAQRELDNGNKVVIAYCEGESNSCLANNPNPKQKFNKLICFECKSRRINGINWLDQKEGLLVSTPLPRIARDKNREIKDFIRLLIENRSNLDLVRGLIKSRVEDLDESVIATLMTTLRDSNPDLGIHWATFIEYVEAGLTAHYQAAEELKKWAPELTYIFNARIVWYRPLMNLLIQKNSDFTVYEYPVSGHHNYLLYYNTHAHDISYQSERLINLIETSTVPEAEMIASGSEWFKRRINRQKTGFEPIFVENQLLGLLPLGWDQNRFNLAFFLSSQDEVNMLHQSDSLSSISQAASIRAISEWFPHISIYVRVHPNVKDSDSTFLAQLADLTRSENVRIIDANSQVDSYTLIDNSDMIVSVGSTVGVEAAYMGTPSLVIGTCYYEKFNCVAVAKSLADVRTVIDAFLMSDRSYFPSRQVSTHYASLYGWAYMNQGVSPKYLIKDDLYDALLIKNNSRTRIRPNLLIKVFNRIAFMPARLVSALSRMTTKRVTATRVFGSYSGLKMLKKLLFNDLPRVP